jgi:hypothetical protein
MKSVSRVGTNLNVNWQRALSLLALSCLLSPAWASAASGKLATPTEYHRYIDPLLGVSDFRTQYDEDGAADASVVYPQSGQPPYGYLKPPEPILDLVRLRGRSLPLLIDCLSDGRITTMHFGGNWITKPMKVPVGYVCLDILMNVVVGRPVSDPDCSNDGLGACMNYGFYFRPDDYYECSERDCFLRSWVSVVRRKWKVAYINHRLKFHNPYDTITVDEYKELRTARR